MSDIIHPGDDNIINLEMERLKRGAPSSVPEVDQEVEQLLIKSSARLQRMVLEARERPLGLLRLLFTDTRGEPAIIKKFHEKWEWMVLTHRGTMMKAARGLSKCRATGQRLTLASGVRKPIELFAGRGPVRILAFDERSRSLRYAQATVTDNGPAKIQELTLDSGRVLRLTPEEPLWTVAGWKQAGGLKVGEYVASIRTDPGPEHPEPLPKGHAYLIGALIGDGNCATSGTSKFTCADPGGLQRFRELATLIGVVLHQEKDRPLDYRLKGIRPFLRQYGLFGKTARVKSFPDSIFRAPAEDVAACLAGYWDADGSAAHGPARMASFSSTSRVLLEQTQSLLLRLGCVATLRDITGTYKGLPYSYHVLFLTGRSAVRFLEIAPCASDKAMRGRAKMNARRLTRYNAKDTDVPKTAVAAALSGVSDTFLRRYTSRRFNIGIRSHTVCEDKVQGLADALFTLAAEPATSKWRTRLKGLTVKELIFRGIALLSLIRDDIWWDRVVSSRECPAEQTWALACPDCSTFICEDGIAHNTTSSLIFLVWFIGKDHELRTKIICENDDYAEQRLGVIKQYIKPRSSPSPYGTAANSTFGPAELLRLVFPEPPLVLDDKAPNTKSTLTVTREVIDLNPTVLAKGVLSAGTGARADIMLLDDIVGYRNCLQFPALREEVKQKLLNEWFPTVAKGGRIWCLYTPWARDDANAYLEETTKGRWAQSAHAHGTTRSSTRSIFPEIKSDADLEEERLRLGELNYGRAYLLRVLGSEDQIINADNLLPYNAALLTPHILQQCRAFVVVDPAKGKTSRKNKDPDSTAVGVGLVYDPPKGAPNVPGAPPFRVFIPEVIQFKAPTRTQIEIISLIVGQYSPVEELIVESQGLTSLEEWLVEIKGLPPITPIPATESKELRLKSITPFIDPDPNTGLPIVYFHPNLLDPSSHKHPFAVTTASGTTEVTRAFYHQAVNFGVVAHDDSLDAVVHLLRKVNVLRLASIMPGNEKAGKVEIIRIDL